DPSPHRMAERHGIRMRVHSQHPHRPHRHLATTSSHSDRTSRGPQTLRSRATNTFPRQLQARIRVAPVPPSSFYGQATFVTTGVLPSLRAMPLTFTAAT